MAYSVFVLDPTTADWAELEVEDLDFTTTYNVADIADLSARKDNITKQFNLKGTKKNNIALGSLFHTNRTSDIADGQPTIGYNYNPLKRVTALIYEDGALIVSGSLRIVAVTYKDKVVTYTAVITGSVTDLKVALADKYLTDLDLTDLKHVWKLSTWLNSQQTSTQRWNSATSSYTTSPFKKGSGYVYPLVDYGENFTNPLFNGTSRLSPWYDIRNMRPAVYAKEYLDRIFKQEVLQGYTYEVKGDAEFLDKIDSLVVPYSAEKLNGKNNAHNFKLYKTSPSAHTPVGPDYSGLNSEGDIYDRYISLQTIDRADSFLEPYGTFRGDANTCFNVNRTFQSDGIIRVKFASLANQFNTPTKVIVQLVQRDFVPDTITQTITPPIGSPSTVTVHNPKFDFNLDINAVAASQEIVLAPFGQPGSSLTNKEVTFEIGDIKFEEGKQLLLRLQFSGNRFSSTIILGSSPVTYSVTEAEVKFPKNQVDGVMTYEVRQDDAVIPKAPEAIKQMDFLMSFMKLFNFYVYSEPLNPQHLIFETYDDFYARTQADIITDTSLDWTSKVNHANGVSIKTNFELPRKYLFEYKQDSDARNKLSKETYAEDYGSFTFNDSYGTAEQKKVDVIFSASPSVEYTNSSTVLLPNLYAVDGNKPKTMKTNIRILFYSGLKSCAEYTLAADTFDKVKGLWGVTTVAANVNTYAMCTEFYCRPGINNLRPVESLWWGQRPKYVHFGSRPEYETTLGLYFNYYANQVTEMTDPNTAFYDCDIMLNEVDIANLDLRVPVYIDFGEIGHGYFKVLKVDYQRRGLPSKVSLQKIPL